MFGYGIKDPRQRVEAYYRSVGAKSSQCVCMDCAFFVWNRTWDEDKAKTTTCNLTYKSINDDTPACSSFEIHNDLLKKGV
jgi:hypothetical protein